MSKSPVSLYDLVLENGVYVTGRRLDQHQDRIDGRVIVHRLALGFRHRLPILGAILRNMWAKSHGARLFDP